MDAKSLIDAQPVLDAIVTTAENTKKDVERDIDVNVTRHDAVASLQLKIVPFIKAYRKTIAGKSAEEREIISQSTIDKIEETITKELTILRDKVLYDRGRASFADDFTKKTKDIWAIALADAERVVEVVEIIERGEEPNNGRNRKPGTRPEKLSVIRKAQAIAAEKNNDTQE
jgi:hypothetical protein